ncbi:MAG: hypothetical protein INQ03_20840 [Candidatus Heimdallarchaeota archaeon]|nr:hypothetical protein [Candidatus Heimdallarchaeota archaeon]
MSSPFNKEKLELITKNRIQMSLVLIMIIEHQELTLYELTKYTGFDFPVLNEYVKNLARLKLVQVIPTGDLPMLKIIDEEIARDFLKVLEDNLYLDFNS